MRIEEKIWDGGGWSSDKGENLDAKSVGLILLFGNVGSICDDALVLGLHESYPNAHIIGGSTAGTIQSGTLSDYPLVATLVSFERGWVEVATEEDLTNETLAARAERLIQKLPSEGLRHVFVLMDGLKLNGSLLARGVNSVNRTLPITGGLAGDDLAFEHTFVLADGPARELQAVAVGFYGDSLHVGVGCETGWEEFGAERIVTRAEGNVVYEIDRKPAIRLYEDYLGEYIKELPASGLRFPLNVRETEKAKEVVRVMMAINDDGSIVFAGDIPQGSTVRLMKTNVDNLVSGADLVASLIERRNDREALAIAVSCTGRRSVLRQLVDEELQVMQERLGAQVHICGFYSYGELAPFSSELLECKLHNQTMTLTVIYED